MSESNDARFHEELAQAEAQPMTQADWAVIQARFYKLEKRVTILSDALNTASATANRADQMVHAHQQYIDMVRAAAVAGTVLGERAAAPRTLDGRTLLVLARYGQMIVDSLERDAPTDAAYVHVKPDAYRELRSALQNVKYVMEHMKLSVASDG